MIISKLKFSILLVITVVLVAVATPVVRANSINVTSFTVAPSGSNFLWTYTLAVSTGATVNTNDYFGFVNWAGFVAGSNSQPTFWTFTNPTTMTCPPTLSCSSPHTGDLVWTYTGSPTLGPGVTLGSFSAISLFDNTGGVGLLQAQDHSSLTGGAEGNTQSVPVPLNVPEPSSILLLGAGFLLTPFLGLKRLS